jgi:SNF2 family DNA or RNA helicase
MLRPYQKDAADFLSKTKRSILCMPMGMGKSLTTLTTLDNLALSEDIFPALVLAPLRVAESTWPGEVIKWPHLKHLRISVITGKPDARKKALESDADIYVTNYENLPWLRKTLNKRWPFKIIISDESTKLKGFRTRQGSVRAKALGVYAHRSSRFIGLTGTIAPNGLQDLWGQLWFVDRGKRLGDSYTAFTERWFRSVRVGDSEFATRLEPYAWSQDEIESRIKDVVYALDVADHFDIAKPIVGVIEVNLPKAAMNVYLDMQEKMFLELTSGEEIEAVNAASKTQKCLQIASGFIYTEEGYEVLHDAKLDALESVIEEANGMPVLVAYNFKADLERLLKRFPKGKAIGKDPKTIDDWNAGKIPIMFVHPKSAGHGLNLQYGSNILCFYGIDWNLEERLQVIERIGPVRQAQAGLNRPVFIYYILAKGTIDKVVMERVDNKKTILEALMEALK